MPTSVTKLVTVLPSTPALLVLCGSLSPVTYQHLLLLETARYYVEHDLGQAVAGGYLSPVNDAYGKASLIKGHHRVRMCELASRSSDWIMTDSWEVEQGEFIQTQRAIRHFHHDVLAPFYGADTAGRISIYMVCGSDLVMSLRNEEIWTPSSVESLFQQCSMLVIPRSIPSDPISIDDWLHRDAPNLARWRNSIHIIHDAVQSSISSTLVRERLRTGSRIRYLVPEPVEDYILQHGLYKPVKHQ
mmetsp:Transcript_10150/g.20505  ORF Transcript_10150/g.20505 Transcript_10150/m.20505 type:complete len:244 (-) Transcript_10150:54-785(-)